MENRATVGRRSSGRVGSALNPVQEEFLLPEEFLFPVSMLDLKIPNIDVSVKCPSKMNLSLHKFPGDNLPMRTCNDLCARKSRNFC